MHSFQKTLAQTSPHLIIQLTHKNSFQHVPNETLQSSEHFDSISESKKSKTSPQKSEHKKRKTSPQKSEHKKSKTSPQKSEHKKSKTTSQKSESSQQEKTSEKNLYPTHDLNKSALLSQSDVENIRLISEKLLPKYHKLFPIDSSIDTVFNNLLESIIDYEEKIRAILNERFSVSSFDNTLLGALDQLFYYVGSIPSSLQQMFPILASTSEKISFNDLFKQLQHIFNQPKQQSHLICQHFDQKSIITPSSQSQQSTGNDFDSQIQQPTLPAEVSILIDEVNKFKEFINQPNIQHFLNILFNTRLKLNYSTSFLSAFDFAKQVVFAVQKILSMIDKLHGEINNLKEANSKFSFLEFQFNSTIIAMNRQFERRISFLKSFYEKNA